MSKSELQTFKVRSILNTHCFKGLIKLFLKYRSIICLNALFITTYKTYILHSKVQTKKLLPISHKFKKHDNNDKNYIFELF